MRLGDLDALKEALTDTQTRIKYKGVFTVDDIKEFIDNAQTVEERPVHCEDCKHSVLSEDGKTLVCCLTMRVGTVRPNFYCGNGEMKGGAK